MVRKLTLGLAVLALIALGGCNLPSRINAPAEETPGALTLAVQTVEAQMTLIAKTEAALNNTPEGGQPTITLAPTNTPEPTDTPDTTACDAAGFVKDVTIDDGTEMLPGEAFTKTWRISNQGECTWNDGYDLVFDEGSSMEADASVQVTKGEVAPGDQVDISVDMIAPADAETYKGIWQMRNDDNQVFTVGGFWVQIVVVEVTAFSSKTSFDVDQTFEADLDSGSSPALDVADIWFRVVAAADKRIEPRNGATILLMGEDRPEYGTCDQADLTADNIQVDSDLVGQWVCFETDQGRLGRFEVVSLLPNDITQIQILKLRYVTWNTPD